MSDFVRLHNKSPWKFLPRSSGPVPPFDWEWTGFDLTAGAQAGQWVGYSDGGPTRPQPAFGSISGQPTPRTDLLALYDDTASGIFLAVFAGDFTARLAGIEVSFGGFVMDAFEIELIDGNTWARFSGIPGDLVSGAVYQVAFGFDLQAAPIITEQPSISPASGRAGTRFVFDVGAAEGRPVPVASGTLTFNGVPVALDPEGGYTPSLPGSLVWSVEWSNGIAPDASAQATAEVEAAFTPAELFASGEQGWLMDLSLESLFQDAAGAIPVTEPGQPVGLVLDQSRGLVLGPELANNGDFSDGTTGWLWFSEGANTLDLVDGGAILTKTGGNTTGVYLDVPAPPGNYEVVFNVQYISGAAPIRLNVSNVGFGDIEGVDLSKSTLEIQKIRLIRFSVDSAVRVYIQATGISDVSILIKNVSVREVPGNHWTQPTALNRPIYQVDAEGNPYLSFNGTNQWMQTAAFAWGSDEATTVSGVRKLSDALIGMIFEFSPDTNNNNGSMYLVYPRSAVTNEPSNGSRGTASVPVGNNSVSFLAPRSDQITTEASISAPFARQRVNGALRVSIRAAQGAGPYGNYPLFVGSRAGSLIFFNGHIYPSLGINRLLSETELASAEDWVAKRTGGLTP